MKDNGFSVKASLKRIRIAPRKLNIVAASIRNLKVSDAMNQLSFLSRKRVALVIKKCLQSAIANAENEFGLDIDKLVVNSATVGRAGVLKRVMPRARGRSSGIKKFLSHLYIELKESK